MRVRRRDEGEGREAVEEDGTEGGGGERRKKEEEDGRHRWPDVERREGAGSGHVRKEGASEGTSGSAGSRSRTYPTFTFFKVDIMDVTARAGSGTSALCGIPGALYLLPPPSRF